MLDERKGRGSVWCGWTVVVLLAACGGSEGVASAPADPQPATSTTTSDEEPATSNRPDFDSPPIDEPMNTTPTVGSCEGPNPSARCDADPATFNGYGAASIITYLEILDDASCCADFDGDGRTDNALGEGFAAIDRLNLLNEELRASLIDGSQTILLEVEGLDDTDEDDEVAVHVYGGQRVDTAASGSAAVALDPATIDRGVAPLFSFDDARVEGGRLVASKGMLEIEASFNGVLLKPAVHDVHVSARIESATPDGLVLRDGEIGGRVELARIYSEINAVAEGCDCLDLSGPLVDSDPNNVGVCAQPDVSTCESVGRETCAALVEVCPVIDIIATNIADVDSDGDGIIESISLGALFSADAARITGVMR